MTSKGQLISEWNFGVSKSSKKWTALASKMGQIKKKWHMIELETDNKNLRHAKMFRST